MSSIIKGLIDESESVFVIYIDGKPSTKYTNAVEAKKDADRLRVRFPNKKFELKSEMHETKQRLDPKCWKGKHKEGTKIKGGVRVNNCVPNESVEESVLVPGGHDATDPEVAILGGAGTMSLSRLKKKANVEVAALANDISKGSFKSAAYNVKQLANTLNTIAAAEEEMKNLYFGEDTDMRFAAEKTPAVNPYGGLKDRSFRGAISENPDYPAVGYQEGGWRQVKLKPAGQLDEFDSFDNATSYRVHSAGELDDEDEIGEDTSYGGGMGQGGYAGQSYRKFKPKMAGTNMKKSSILKGITGESE